MSEEKLRPADCTGFQFSPSQQLSTGAMPRSLERAEVFQTGEDAGASAQNQKSR